MPIEKNHHGFSAEQEKEISNLSFAVTMKPAEFQIRRGVAKEMGFAVLDSSYFLSSQEYNNQKLEAIKEQRVVLAVTKNVHGEIVFETATSKENLDVFNDYIERVNEKLVKAGLLDEYHLIEKERQYQISPEALARKAIRRQLGRTR